MITHMIMITATNITRITTNREIPRMRSNRSKNNGHIGGPIGL